MTTLSSLLTERERERENLKYGLDGGVRLEIDDVASSGRYAQSQQEVAHLHVMKELLPRQAVRAGRGRTHQRRIVKRLSRGSPHLRVRRVGVPLRAHRFHLSVELIQWLN